MEIKKYQFDAASPVIPRIRFRDSEYLLRFERYRCGNVAIYLENRKGPYAELTIELPNITLEPNQIMVRQKLEGIDIPGLLRQAGIVEPVAASAVLGEAAKLFQLSDAAEKYIAFLKLH